MEAGDELRPSHEASSDGVRVYTADDDEAAEPTDLQVVVRPDPRGTQTERRSGALRPSEKFRSSQVSQASQLSPSSPASPSPQVSSQPQPQPDPQPSAAVEAPTAPPAKAPQPAVDAPPSEPYPLTGAFEHAAPDVLTAVERLRMQVATLSLILDVEGVGPARREREGMLSQLDDYLLPRLRRRDAPLLAVIGGSTGAGKSTLTNSIVRREVSRSGVLRPTTRSPVLVHHPFDSGAFMTQRILPRLTRVTSTAPEPLQPIDPHAPRITGLRLVPHDGLTPGLALIDAPDIDSLVQTNRDLAVQLLQAADLWIFVTTAARYADAMPWQMLRQAADRGVAIAVVLDRVPPEALQELRIHLATRLRDRGLGGAPLFTIPEIEPVNGFLPEPVVAPLKQWLRRVASDERSRTVIADRSMRGVLRSLPARAQLLATAADAQAVAWKQLHDEVEDVFGVARKRLLGSLIDGSLISGEVLARWQDFMADGEFIRRLNGGPPTLAERVNAAVRREVETVQPLDIPVTEGITSTIRAAVRAAADQVLTRWRQHPFGSALLDARGHQVTALDVESRLERSVRDWRVGVSSRIAAAVQETTAARTGAGVDLQTAADVLFIVALDERSDGREGDSPAAASVAAAHRVVATFLGAERVSRLAADAREDLVSRAAVLLDAERQRLEKLLVHRGNPAGRGDALRAAADVVEEAG